MDVSIRDAAFSGLAKAIGESTTQALGFYADFSLIESDPERFDQKLRSVFPVGHEVVETIILNEVFLVSGTRPQGGMSFTEGIKLAAHAGGQPGHRVGPVGSKPAEPSCPTSRAVSGTCSLS